MPFPMKPRRQFLYLQIFNNFKIDGTCTYLMRSFKPMDFKLPEWIKPKAMEVLEAMPKKKKELTVMSTESLCGEIKLKGPHKIDFQGQTHMCLNTKAKIPASLKPYFGKKFMLGMYYIY